MKKALVVLGVALVAVAMLSAGCNCCKSDAACKDTKAAMCSSKDCKCCGAKCDCGDCEKCKAATCAKKAGDAAACPKAQ